MNNNTWIGDCPEAREKGNEGTIPDYLPEYELEDGTYYRLVWGWSDMWKEWTCEDREAIDGKPPKNAYVEVIQ